MSRRSKPAADKALVLFAIAVLVSAPIAGSAAQAQQTAGKRNPWQFGVSLYGWFPDIKGQTAFTQPGGGNDFEIGIDSKQ